ncbi:hypothetical protein BX600DRAFT_436909 [Xylariales sp. PMI_506]|nr:hypothetical protein BX600DRAFT_436909 [Xylariales sp. PMI_506]
MALGSSGILSVIELIFYIPCIIGSFIICRRHGFTRSSGWIYTFILCFVRIVGSICYLASLSNPSANLLEAALIMEFVGISPLLFATLGLLSRFVDWTNTSASSPGLLNVKFFRLLQLLIMLGMILSIAGGTSAFSSSSDSSSGSATAAPGTESQAGVILYCVAFAAIILVLVISLPKMAGVPAGERMLAIAVAIASPLIAVRILYSVLTVFVHDSTFNSLDGSVVVKAFMDVVEEFLVVVLYILLGFRLDHLRQDQQGEILSRPWKAKKGAPGQAAASTNYQRPQEQAANAYYPPTQAQAAHVHYQHPQEQAANGHYSYPQYYEEDLRQNGIPMR